MSNFGNKKSGRLKAKETVRKNYSLVAKAVSNKSIDGQIWNHDTGYW